MSLKHGTTENDDQRMVIEDDNQSQSAKRTPKRQGAELRVGTPLQDNILSSQFSKYVTKLRTERIVNNRRLIITKIILENFKSYNGIKIIGPFHKVILNLLFEPTSRYPSHSPLSSVPTAQGSQTR